MSSRGTGGTGSFRRPSVALAQTHMKELINQAYFEIVCEDQGIEDVEGLKKKLDATLSKRRGEGRG